jgi:ADP-ribose pyrophosphatase
VNLLVGGDQVVAADHQDGFRQDVQLAEYILHSAVAGHLDLATGIAEHDLHWTSFGVYRKMSRMTDHRRGLARAPWRTLTSRDVYANPWIRVREDVAEMPDGRTTLYGVVQCKPCIGVLPFLDERTVVLVGQYRYVAREFSWEMPTGAIRADETEDAAVQRELAEEAGYEAGRLVKLCHFHSSKSVMEETAHIYLAEGLRPVVRDADDTEFIEVRPFAFDDVVRMVETSQIVDAMTVVAVLHAARRR